MGSGHAPRRMYPGVVSPLQHRVARTLGRGVSDYGKGFADVGLWLDGGTALASYYLAHRESDDLDYFGNPSMNAGDVATQMRSALELEGLNTEPAGGSSVGMATFVVRGTGERADRPLKIDVCRTSPFRLAPLEATTEGVPVASYRDVCAGKFHALCDRFEPRDFVDLHAILSRPRADGSSVDAETQRRRFGAHAVDLLTSDPGLTVLDLGKAIERGAGRALVSGLPLQLLVPVTDAQVHTTVDLVASECEEFARQAISGVQNFDVSVLDPVVTQ